jgi:hypothetical protein
MTPDPPPLACRCGDTGGPWALTPDGPLCERCVETPPDHPSQETAMDDNITMPAVDGTDADAGRRAAS